MNQYPKILSFSSPKGGVGRTLTLSNCAKIYSEGVKWAGLESSVTILLDLDFHAPGIHYYDFTDNEKSMEYEIFGKFHSSFESVQSELDKCKTGIAFLLSKIVNDADYRRICKIVIESRPKDKNAIKKYREYVFGTLFKKNDFNPLNHLIQLKDKSLFVIPAGSSRHPEYSDTIFAFDWLNFINNYLGIYLIDCIIFKVKEYITSINQFKNKPVRILLDQQAGISISAALNRTLADVHVLVGGFNGQNKAGMKALVDNYFKTYKNEPWIVLNQYNLRTLPFEYKFEARSESPHSQFKEYDDKERVQFINLLAQSHESLRDKIFVTEFVNEAIQKEHFYNSEKASIQELIKLLVSIEKSFEEQKEVQLAIPEVPKIIFIGERIQFDGEYSGPFNGIYELLQTYYSNSEIIGIAATHEEIVSLVTKGEMKISLKKSNRDVACENLQSLISGKYNLYKQETDGMSIRIEDFDFIGYPYYIFDTLFKNKSILAQSEKSFAREIAVENSLIGTSELYYQKNIFRWNEYAITKEKTFIGVPLFFNFQLLVFRQDYFSNRVNLADEFRQDFHRQFKGFSDPDDLFKFAELTYRHNEDKFKNVMLCGNPSNIAMWYEWQTIFSIFYYKNHSNIPRITSYNDYIEFILTDAALDATLMYLKLRKFTDSSDENKNSYDWDELIRNFYLLPKSSLIFIWSDSIPIKDRINSEFIYQVPPSFHVFEESWLLSIIKKNEPEITTEQKICFMNKYLTPEYQEKYVLYGGLPVHRNVLSSLDIWRRYPFIPPLWSIYENTNSNQILNKRDSFDDIFKVGKSIATILDDAYKNIDVLHYDEKSTLIKLRILISENINKNH